LALDNQFIGFSPDPIEVKLMIWYHHCFTFDYEKREYNLYLDGKKIASGVYQQRVEHLIGKWIN